MSGGELPHPAVRTSPASAVELLAALSEYRLARRRLLEVLALPSSNRDPVPEVAEHLVAAILGGAVASSRVQRGWDVMTPEGTVQVRTLSNTTPDHWINEHVVRSVDGVDRYALVILEGLEVSAVVVLPADLSRVGALLHKRHGDQATTLQLTRQDYVRLRADPSGAEAAGVLIWTPAGLASAQRSSVTVGPLTGHQIQIATARGLTLTLADLWPTPCRAVIVGVNPAPRSVELGHYYQGSDGRRALSRLRAAGLLPTGAGGYADDQAMAAGVGFTDLVKRPTSRSTELTAGEVAEGRTRLRAELEARRVPLVVCVFKPAVVALFGVAARPGFQPQEFAGSQVFRMPGPYAASAEAERAMQELASYLDDHG